MASFPATAFSLLDACGRTSRRPEGRFLWTRATISSVMSPAFIPQTRMLGRSFVFLCPMVLVVFLSACSDRKAASTPPARPKTLLNVSGMSWVAGDVFLAVHDIKNHGDKAAWPRFSLCTLASNEFDGIVRTELHPDFPGLPPGDLESICSIPGTSDFLMVESGQEGASYSRIFHARLSDGNLTVLGSVNWPVPIVNVEASEVCRVGDQLYFLYAERSEGADSTAIHWAELGLQPVSFGAFESVVYRGVNPVGPMARAIVALDIDEEGNLYTVSAYDPGTDDGPYRSTAWQIGKIGPRATGGAEIHLGPGVLLGVFDGFKAEAIAVRPTAGGGKEVFIGTDDEHNGGIIRILP